MNKETLAGDWNVLKGKIKERWGRITDDDLTQINGRKEQLLGKIQQKYGLAKERAQQEFAAWEKQCSCGSSCKSTHAEEEHENRPISSSKY